MTTKTLLGSLLSVALLTACGAETEELDLVTGDWFRCEFFDSAAPSPPSDSCQMLDDDGLRFTSAGIFSTIEVKNSSEEGCLDAKVGKCFDRDQAMLEIDQKTKGSYEVDGDRVIIQYDDGDSAEFVLVPFEGIHMFNDFIKTDAEEPKTKYKYMYRYQ